jgi:hypothetical protein
VAVRSGDESVRPCVEGMKQVLIQEEIYTLNNSSASPFTARGKTFDKSSRNFSGLDRNSKY